MRPGGAARSSATSTATSTTTTRAKVAGHLAVCRRCGLDEQAYREIKDALARRGGALPDAPIDRLRAFAGELSGGDPPTSRTGDEA